MATEQYVLAFDHGTSGVKSALVSTRGAVRGFEFQATPTAFSDGGGAEQDPEDWWAALLATGRKLVASGLVPVEDIVAVCVSSTFSTTVVVGADGRHLMPALTWMDSRGAPYVRRLVRGFPSLRGYGLRSLVRWISRTGGGPALSGKDDIAHVLLVKHERPEVWERARAFLPSKDYLNLRLTGELAASYDSIHLFWVTDIRDVRAIRYDPSLIAQVGLDPARLPPLRASTDVLGPLRPDVTAALGLPRPLPVVVGSPDHQSACIGSGAIRDFEGHLYVGTSSWIECMVPFKRTDLLHSIASFPSAIPGRYQCVNEQDLAGGCLTFLVDNVLFHGGRLRASDPSLDRYRLLDELAAEAPPGAGRVLFTPWLNGERTPVDDADLRGGFHNLSTTTTLAHLARAVLEGVAYNARWSLAYVERFVRRPLEPLRVIGGGARSALWCQIFADVLDREIHAVRDPLQANARGAALIAAAALGHVGFEEIPMLVPIERVHRPDPAHRRLYDRLFATFVALYRRNRTLYRRLNGSGTPGIAGTG